MTRQIQSVMCLALSTAACVAQPAISLLPSLTSCRATHPDSARAVTWVGPTDVRDRAKLDEWCDAVGPVIVTDSALANATADRLTVVTWNTHVGAGQIVSLVDALRRGELTDGRPVEHFVLLLQEVLRRGSEVPDLKSPAFRPPASIGSPSRASMSVTELARALELGMLYAPSMRNGSGSEDRGNAIVSSLPFDDPLIIELPFERQRRVAVSSVVRMRTAAGVDRRLRVVSVHLDTSVALVRGGPAKARARQARALIAALPADREMTIVGGDLNAWWGDDEPAVKELQQAFPDAERFPRGVTWSGPLGAGNRVDYLFARLGGRPLEVHRVRNRFGSDHHPLVATVDLTAGSDLGFQQTDRGPAIATTAVLAIGSDR